MARARGDRSKPAMSSKRSAGPAATTRSMAKGPRGRFVTAVDGREGRTNNGRPAGTSYKDRD